MKRNRILIVGGVAAGPAAAAKAKRLDPRLDITLFEQGEFISYGTCSMPYYVGQVIEDYQRLIVFTPKSFRQEKQCAVFVRHRVESISPHRKFIVVRNLEKDSVEEHKYDKLVLATGAKARIPDPAWLKFSNVLTIKNLQDSIRLKSHLHDRRPSRVVIVGGGFIGMEMAEALTRHRLDVTVVHKDALPMPSLETESRKIVLDELHRQGVRFTGDATVSGFDGEGDVVTRVRTSAGDMPADMVLLAMGFQPNTDMAAEARLRCGPLGGFVVDAAGRTSVEHIYAAGACTEIRNAVTNKPLYLPLGHIANRMGWVVGENLAGVRSEFGPVVRTTAVKIFDLEVAASGLSLREALAHGFQAETTAIHAPSRSKMYPGGRELFVMLVVDRRTGRLLGANLLGEEGAALRANIVSAAIRNRMTVKEFSKLDLMYTPPFSPVWDPLLVAANASIRKS